MAALGYAQECDEAERRRSGCRSSACLPRKARHKHCPWAAHREDTGKAPQHVRAHSGSGNQVARLRRHGLHVRRILHGALYPRHRNLLHPANAPFSKDRQHNGFAQLRWESQ